MTSKVMALDPIEHKKIIRRRMGLSQSDIAKHIGVSALFYRLWENGQRKSSRLDQAFENLLQQKQ